MADENLWITGSRIEGSMNDNLAWMQRFFVFGYVAVTIDRLFTERF